MTAAPRRRPRQARSRAMVERILAAGREVLVRDGYDQFTTNRVADTAGISPGSLYQYFGDKHAIVAALVERYADDVADDVARSLADHLDTSGATLVRTVAAALVSALEKNADLLRVVVDELPARQNAARLRALERRVQELLATYLAAIGTATGAGDGATGTAAGDRDAAHRRGSTVAWVLVLALESVTVRWVLDSPPIDRDELVDELVALCLGYLPAPPRER